MSGGDKDTMRMLEDVHVHDVYNEIAGHFSETRHKPWPQVVDFISSLPKHAVLIDVGCGNGKYFGQHPDQIQIGCDRSLGLVSICRLRGFHGVRCDCLMLPFRSGIADGIICIAVIHHLSTKERRKKAIEEMLRILRPGGRCLIYVWAKDQRRGNKPSSYLKKNVIFSNPESKQVLSGSLELPIHSNRMDFEHNDLLVPWTRKGGDQTTFLRYYHVFDEGELENLIQSAEGDCTIEKVYYDQGNWCVIVQKRPELLRKDGK